MPDLLSARNDGVGVDGERFRELVPADRCDRCGARALARAHKGDLEILFCRHHAQKHIEALTDQGFFLYESDDNLDDN